MITPLTDEQKSLHAIADRAAQNRAEYGAMVREAFRSMQELEEKETRTDRMKRAVRGWLLWKSGPLALLLTILLWLKVLLSGALF